MQHDSTHAAAAGELCKVRVGELRYWFCTRHRLWVCCTHGENKPWSCGRLWNVVVTPPQVLQWSSTVNAVAENIVVLLMIHILSSNSSVFLNIHFRDIGTSIAACKVKIDLFHWNGEEVRYFSIAGSHSVVGPDYWSLPFVTLMMHVLWWMIYLSSQLDPIRKNNGLKGLTTSLKLL